MTWFYAFILCVPAVLKESRDCAVYTSVEPHDKRIESLTTDRQCWEALRTSIRLHRAAGGTIDDETAACFPAYNKTETP